MLTLSNGQAITIAVGQTTGSVDYAVRADDPYVQGTLALTGGDHEHGGRQLRECGDHGHGVDQCGGRCGHEHGDALLERSGDGGGGLDDHLHGERGQRGDGRALVLTLSNGQTITIAVGETTGSVDYVVRADDAYAQGTVALPAVGITGNSGGNFENVATTGTVLTSVTDDNDTSTVTLSSTADGETVEEGTTITYTAEVDNAVTGEALVLTLSNGQTVTIAVGATTGSVDYDGARR